MNFCACLGPRPDEPYCMCEMISRGIKTKEDYARSQKDIDKLSEALASVFEWKSDGS